MTKRFTFNLSELKQWQTFILLMLFGMVSIGLGALQLNTISQGAVAGAYMDMPVPIVLHIVFGIAFNLLSPFQFVDVIRARFPKFHRCNGILLVLSAVIVTFTALWMNHYYPSYGGLLKYSGIVAYNIVMLSALYLAIKHALNQNIKNHRLWMMRTVAVGLAPATQRIIIIPLVVIFGEDIVTDLFIGLLIWVGLIINLLFVEFIRLKARCHANTKLTRTGPLNI